MKKYLMIFLVLAFGMMLTGCTNPSEQGVKELKNGNYKEAEEQFQKAIKKEINVGDAYRGIGLVKWEQEEYEEASKALKKALEEGAQKTVTIYSILGNCAMKQEQASEALNYYRLALAAEGNSEELEQEIKFNEIAAYEQQKDWESAKTKLKEYIEAYPDDAQAVKEAEFLETR